MIDSMIEPGRHKYNFLRSKPMQVKRERVVYAVEKDENGTGRLKQRTETVTETVYDVSFPLGYSVRLNERELKRHGFDEAPRIVDTLTGDVLSGASELVQGLADFAEPARRPGKGATEG